MQNWPVWLATAFASALVGTWGLRRYALTKGLMDQPGQRRSHTVATPRGGGMSIVLVVLGATLVAAWMVPSERVLLLGFCAGLMLVAGIGWWDDHTPLPAALRLAVHMTASAWLGAILHHAGASLPEAAFTAIASVVLINVWNFMDGINGLAGSQALLAAIAYALVLPPPTGWVAVALAGACLGFLPFNFPRAGIFMGDGGSGALGYMLAALMACAIHLGVANLGWAWLPLTVFLVDAGFTLVARMRARQAWWQPHAQHVYQALARKTGSHSWVTLGYAFYSGFLVCIFLSIGAIKRSVAALIVVTGLAFAVATWFFLRRKLRGC